MKFIPDDVNIDFMSARKKAFIGSGIAIAASLTFLFAMGLNLGIDFKGGSAVVATFESGSMTDRGAIRTAMLALLEEEIGEVDGEVSVQDFSTGLGSEITTCVDVQQPDGLVRKSCSTRNVDRYLIYSEVTSLISPERREAIVTALQDKYGAETQVDSREDSDTFYIRFATDAPVLAREEELRQQFASLGYAKVSVTSDLEQQIEVDFLREQDLLLQDQQRADEGAAAAPIPTQAEYEARKQRELQDKADNRFTVNVEELRGKVEARLATVFPEQFITVESSTSVSPSVGEDLFNNGLLAILYALIGILIYITVRFDFRYAPGAVAALLHDIIITMGLFALLQIKFSLPIIAALLTIVGYSLNDTIVVLDRVRETFESFRGQGFLKLLNRAVNSTLSRTVLTSGTTLLVVASILIFGGGQIRDFALALLIGILVGTYSSIFIASPLVYYMDQYIERREAQAKAAAKPDHNKPGRGDKDKGRAKATA